MPTGMEVSVTASLDVQDSGMRGRRVVKNGVDDTI
jgi:hypothetical protein